ncbi:MAG: DUF87 domain-containing protein [Thermoanaerobaculia bacterium]|nr:DUF87 domain-containing protein [Thermoanaerobaculia bacterium]
MTIMSFAAAVAAAFFLAGLVTIVLRRASRPNGLAVDLVFDTAVTRAREGWTKFWSRDPFIHGQRERKGTPFATYAVPGGRDSIVTRFAANDLQHHTLVLGSTGSGKSTLLEALAHEHFRAKRPLALIDLHGDLYARAAALALHEKVQRLVLVDFTKPDLLPGWNPLDRMAGVDVGRQVDLLVSVLKRLYSDEVAASWAWGVKVEELMRAALRACIESASLFSLADLPSFFLVPAVREGVLASAPESARDYFTTQYGAREEMYASAVVNKLTPFLGSVAVQRFLGQPRSTFDLFGAIERGDTVLINLAAGYLGPAAKVMGRLIVNTLQVATLRREAVSLDRRHPYSLIIDEAHALAGTDSGLEDFLVAARKYGVFVTLAAQGLSLFPPSFRPHLLGNTGRQFFFRLPYSEAKALANDVLEPLGTVFRHQIRPNDAIDDPLLTPAEEMAWRTRELANLPVGACYWFMKERPYKARRIQILQPPPWPFPPSQLDTRIHASVLDGRGAEQSNAAATPLPS